MNSVTDINDINPRWLSLAKACSYASMSENTLLNFIKTGDIYASKKVGKWYVDRESIDAFFESEKTFAKITVAQLKEAHV